MNTYETIVTKIIREQEMVIGPMAWESARHVTGLKVVDENAGTVEIQAADNRMVVNDLVGEYESLFGRASREVCREAVAALVADLPSEQIPESLR